MINHGDTGMPAKRELTMKQLRQILRLMHDGTSVATWLLGKDRWSAGQQLMASANPEQWKAIQQARNLERDNHQSIADCQKMAKRTGQDQRCRVDVRANPGDEN
jgi:hypothetical protein